jgi:hypothetical protein
VLLALKVRTFRRMDWPRRWSKQSFPPERQYGRLCRAATLDASDRQRAIARYQEAVAVPRFAQWPDDSSDEVDFGLLVFGGGPPGVELPHCSVSSFP